MTIKVHYRIIRDRAGLPQDYAGARRFEATPGEALEMTARAQLAADYQVPESAVEICRIED